jgi:hypothetical protein
MGLTTGTLHDMATNARVDRVMRTKTTCQLLEMQTEQKRELTQRVLVPVSPTRS